MKSIEKAKNLVEECLREDERCRNDDLWLILKIWQKKQHINVFIPYEKLDEMISSETITRCRRHIQNTQMKYLPTDTEVMKRRGIRQESMREYFGGR